MAKGGFRGMPGGMNQAAMMKQAQKLQQEMLARGAFVSLMTGSGSAVFGLFSSQEPARKCCSALRKVVPFVAQCKTIPHTFYAI